MFKFLNSKRIAKVYKLIFYAYKSFDFILAFRVHPIRDFGNFG